MTSEVIKESSYSVLLEEMHVGTLVQRGDFVRFMFDDDYWRRPRRRVLGAWFEDNPRMVQRAALRLPVWFSNLLPEGQQRQWIAVERGVSVDREMELLAQVGNDLPGAVRVILNSDVGEWLETGQDDLTPAHPAEKNMGLKFSLAGVGLKFSMVSRGERLTLPATDELGDWIVKFPHENYRQVPENEHAMMALARDAGIEVPRTRLITRSSLPNSLSQAWPNGEQFAYAVERFDRLDGRRVHIEDFAQVRGFYPQAKYSGSFETVMNLAYRRIDYASLDEAVRRVAFNVLIGNGDAHLKNWSFRYADGKKAQISPAYDLVSTFPYLLPEGDDLGLKFAGTRRFEAVDWHSFERFAVRAGVNPERVLTVVSDVVERVNESWSSSSRESPPDHVTAWLDEWIPRASERLRPRRR